MPEASLTCIDFWCKAGSSSENSGEEGIAHFLEHMVFKGSRSLGAGEFDLKIEALGGSSNAATGFDDVHFYVLVPSISTEIALEHLLDLVLTPSLEKDSYTTEREVVLEEIAQYKDQPDEQVVQRLLSECWGKHPYGRPILGFESSLRATNPEKMREFHANRFTATNCCLAVAGFIPKNINEILLNSALCELEDKSINDINKSSLSNIEFKTGVNKIEIQRLESSRILMAWQVPPAKEQEIIMGIDLVSTVLAEGRNSRLVQRLREELRLVESIEMEITILEQGSLVILEACCLEKNIEKVTSEINKELILLGEIQIKEEELRRAVQLVSNGLYFGLETSSQIASFIGNQSLWNREQPLLESLKYIPRWTPEKLAKRIIPLLQPHLSCTLIATPEKLIKNNSGNLI